MVGLPPRAMPAPLRVIAWLIVVLGVLGLLLSAWAWYSEGTVKLGRVLTAVLYVWAGNKLRRGDREGLDHVLGIHGFLLALLIYSVLAREPFVTRLFGVALWVLIVGGYLAYCRLYLPWRDDYEPGSEQE